MCLVVSENKKLINLPNYIWEHLEKDARRCRRSVTKQIEAVLISYFGLEDVEIDGSLIHRAREEQGREPRREPVAGEFNSLAELYDKFPKREVAESEKLRPEDAEKFNNKKAG